MSGPPRLARIIARLVSPHEERAHFLDDLTEEYEARARDVGWLRAAGWYWREVMLSIPPLLGERLRRRGRRTERVQRNGGSAMDGVLTDVRFTLRLALRRPLMTSVVVLAIAAGIGTTAAVTSVIQGVLLDPLPFPDANRIVVLKHGGPGFPVAWSSVSYPDLVDWRAQSRSFEAMVGLDGRRATLGSGGEPELVNVLLPTEGFERVLGIRPVLGRAFVSVEFTPGHHRVVMLSDELWRTRFGSDPSIVGSTILLDAEPHTVVGVLPPLEIPITMRTRLWAPLIVNPNNWQAQRESTWMTVLARLRPGVDVGAAKADLDGIATRLAAHYPASNADRSAVRIVPLRETVVGNVRSMLMLLFGAVTAVLLIACVNVAGVLMARTHERRPELAVRLALGGDGRRLARQLLTESLVLSLAGGMLGLALAPQLLDALLALYPGGLPRAPELSIDVRVVAVAIALTVATGLVFGLPPARRALHGQLERELQSGLRTSESVAHQRVRSLLVAAQVAFSIVLLVAGIVLLRSFLNLTREDPGFDAGGLVTFQVVLARDRHPTAGHAAAFYAQFADRLTALPGVRSAGNVNMLPFSSGTWRSSVRLQGAERRSLDEEINADVRLISPGYLETMGIDLVDGRPLTGRELPGTPRIALVNRTLARSLTGDDNIVGRTIAWGEDTPVEIVGVIEDVHHYGLAEPDRYEILFSASQDPRRERMVVIRADGDPAALVPAIRAELRALDPMVPMSDVATMEQRLATSIAPERFRALLIGSLAAIACLLAVLGIYAVVTNTVNRRAREIGIRLALGERPRTVVIRVVTGALKVATVGAVIGAPSAALATRWLEGFVFGVDARDPATIIAVPLILLGAAAAAALVPALAASRTDPLRVLARD